MFYYLTILSAIFPDKLNVMCAAMAGNKDPLSNLIIPAITPNRNALVTIMYISFFGAFLNGAICIKANSIAGTVTAIVGVVVSIR